MIAHGLYLLLMRHFPYIQLSDPVFISSCLLAVIQHCSWFYYFMQTMPSFNLILSIFVLCVWLLPFTFFISLSTNEPPVLPGFMQLTPNEQLMMLPEGAENIAAARKGKNFNRLVNIFETIKSISQRYLPRLTGSNSVKLT
jgi:hypothetical protein